MPISGRGVAHFVADQSNTVVARIGFDLVDRRARPCLDSRLHLHGGSYCYKTEWGTCASYTELTIRSVVIHVALAGICLAPGIFMWCDVLSLGKVGRAEIKRRVQIIDLDKKSM